MLHIFERKVLRKIMCPDQDDNIWRNRFNAKIYNLFKASPVSEYIRLQRLRWVGHVARMEDERLPKRILNSQIHGKVPVGRPRKRWEVKVYEGARDLLGVRVWKRVKGERQAWRQKLKVARARFGL